MSATSIQWTDKIWNPTRGCSRVSPGCDHCYAMGQAQRFSGKGQPYEGLTTIRNGKVDWAGVARFIPEMLGAPLKWRKPARVFVNSMSDLFHESLSNEDIAAVFGVMAAGPHLTFQVLTKRPERAREWFAWIGDAGWAERRCHSEAARVTGRSIPHPPDCTWPLPNVWLGVSVENQKTAAERIPLLLELPVAARFVSAEPLLDAVDLRRWMWPTHWRWDGKYPTPEAALAAGAFAERRRQCLVSAYAVFLDWVIVGGESGNGARPFNVQWARSIVGQCRDAGVACFVKQLGAHPGFLLADEEARGNTMPSFHHSHGDLFCKKLQDRAGGDMAEWPESLRVREFPEARP